MKQYQRTHWLPFIAGLLLLFSGGVNAAAEVASATIDDRSLFAEALVLTEQGEWAEAARLFSDIARRHPGWPEPKNNLAVAMLKMGKLEQAQQALEEAVGSQPSFRTAQHNRQRLYDHLAAVAYERALGKTEQLALPQLDLLTRLQAAESAGPVATDTPPADSMPAPVSPPAVQAPSSEQLSATITQRLQAWSKAWSDADVDAYLSAYSRKFRPEEPGRDYNQWRNIRRARLTLASNTQVNLQDIRIYLDPNHEQALAQFVQSYRSDNYQDRVIKQLRLGLERGQWLILSERVIEKLN